MNIYEDSETHLAGAASAKTVGRWPEWMYSANNLPAIGPRPNPDEANPLTMNRLLRMGILPMMGFPSRENGMVPAQVRWMGMSLKNGRTSVA